jgi:DUF4097 and DUF4098 domain-containing protein YvlB
MLRMSRALRLCLPLCLLASACDVKVGEKGVSLDVASEQASETWRRSYTLPAKGRLELSSVSGSVHITGTSASQAEVTIVREATAMTRDDATQRVAGVSIVEDAKPDAVRIEIRAADREHRGRLALRATIAVPRGLVVSVRNQDGRIELENVDGEITVAVANGPITGRGVSGSLSASAVNGRLSIDLNTSFDKVDLTATNGAVRLGLPAEANADLQLEALNGGVTVDPRLNLVSQDPAASGGGGEFFSKRVTGRLRNGGPTIVARAINGAVRVGLPGDDLERRGRR